MPRNTGDAGGPATRLSFLDVAHAAPTADLNAPPSDATPRPAGATPGAGAVGRAPATAPGAGKLPPTPGAAIAPWSGILAGGTFLASGFGVGHGPAVERLAAA